MLSNGSNTLEQLEKEFCFFDVRSLKIRQTFYSDTGKGAARCVHGRPRTMGCALAGLRAPGSTGRKTCAVINLARSRVVAHPTCCAAVKS
jgi:hypothetical protein